MKKNWFGIAAVAVPSVVIIIVLAVVISCNVLVSGPVIREKTGEPYLFSCTSVVLFGKLEIADVDKVVISSDDKTLTITDQALVEQIVDKTKVAKWAYSSGCGCCEQRGWRIDLYRGDQLARSMDWIEDDIVKVYDCDLTHWVFPVDVQHERSIGGYARLSHELEDQLHDMLVNC